MTLSYLDTLVSFFGSPSLLFLSTLCALVLKITLLVALNSGLFNSRILSKGTIILSLVLAFSSIVDFLYILRTLQILNICPLYSTYNRTIKRINWAANICFHLCLSLFTESLVSKNIRLPRIYTLCRLIFGIFLASSFLLMLFLPYNTQTFLGPLLREATYFFNLIIGLSTICISLWTIGSHYFPRILKYQVKIFLGAFMAPQLIIKCLTYNPFTDEHLLDTYLFVNLSSIILTGAMYYCTFRLMGLRFLNTREQISTSRKFNFVSLLKDVLVQLSSIANSSEFRHVTQQVFSKAFLLPVGSVRLVLMQDENYQITDEQMQLLQTCLAPDRPLTQLLNRTKVITRDEIDFSAYYDQNPAYTEASDFLRKLKADVFIPVYDRHTILGCIVVAEEARPHKLYSGGEQDEMAVFATSLSSIITLVKNRNIDVLLARKNSLETELYHRHRELGHYQESIRSFLRQAHERKIGILYYKNNAFTFGNQAAHEFVPCDPNMHQGHPLTIQLKKIAQNTEKYAAAQNTTVYIDAEQRLAISSFPSLEKQSTILVIAPPDIADVVRLQSDLLRDPGQWNYLLYLETTETGRLINRLFPGNSKTLLNFKIDLLRATLSHRAILINARAEDRSPLIELFQTTGQRQQLHTITLKEPEKGLSIAQQLFGFAKILGTSQEQPSLIERLDKIGAIYIENVHFLSRETQTHLAEFLRYGAFTAIKDDHRIPAEVRIICSSAESLHLLVEQGTFLPELLDELRHHTLFVPQPAALDRQEFEELAKEYLQLLLKNHSLKKILLLSEREVNLLYAERYMSFFELKRRLNTLISTKATKHETLIKPASPTDLSTHNVISTSKKSVKNQKHGSIDTTSLEEPLIKTPDERVNQAILLGKKALKDRELMIHLWNTFQNQARIATLLGVNRSSVNRRYKHFNIS